MFGLDQKTLMIILVIIFIFLITKKRMESFDKNTVVFVPQGEPRFGLRGEPWNSASALNRFMRPDRHIRLHDSGGEMWESNLPPSYEGIKDCKKVPCPENNDEYDKIDSCWKCGKEKQFCACLYPLLDALKIPDVHPH